ncbi:hypothetical protein [Sphingomonas corticis]|uniref:Uncharacterized protein n=1 Tax=Sphingomonas corticis TaxID=2722791 RepID=A0ABX1CUG1_9SPHN|nr:hypothetical protein [Sphingomonas corticis]NJR80047.1 hypothetical protein [Sphingomonas corticis]
MFIGTHRNFDAAQILDHVRTLFAPGDVGNGTPIPDALAAALAADARAAGVDARQILTKTHEDLVDTAVELIVALQSGKGEFEMPFGTSARSLHKGSVTLNGSTYVLDAGRPGLHALEETRRDAHGPNLQLLHRLIERKTRKLACRRLGLPTPRKIVDVDERNTLQFAPSPDAGGAVLQCFTLGMGAIRFCSVLPEQVGEMADQIVADMRAFWKRRVEIGGQAAEIRRLADAGIVRECGPDAPLKVHALSIDISTQRDVEKPSFYVEYLGVDEALRSGTVIDYVSTSHPRAGEDLTRIPWLQRLRSAELDELRSLGADGRIDDVAAAIAAAAPGGAAAVLSRLAKEYDTFISFETSSGPFHATLYWRDGVIRAEAEVANRLDLNREVLELERVKLPEMVEGALVGRKLRDVAQLPFDCDCVIEDAEEIRDEALRLRLDIGIALADCATGRIWPQPHDFDDRAWKRAGAA